MPRGLVGIVNNAGINKQGPLEFLPIEDFQYVMDVNVTGHIRVIQAFMPL